MSASPTDAYSTSSSVHSGSSHPPPPPPPPPYHPHVVPLGPRLAVPIFPSDLPVACLPSPISALLPPPSPHWPLLSSTYGVTAGPSWATSPFASASSSMLFVPARTVSVRRYSTPSTADSGRTADADTGTAPSSAYESQPPADEDAEDGAEQPTGAAAFTPPPLPPSDYPSSLHGGATENSREGLAEDEAPRSPSPCHRRRSSMASALSPLPSRRSSPCSVPSNGSNESSQVPLCDSSSASQPPTPELPFSSAAAAAVSLYTQTTRSAYEAFASASSLIYGDDIPRLGRLHLNLDRSSSAVTDELAEYNDGLDMDADPSSLSPHPIPATTAADASRRFSYSSIHSGSLHSSPAFRRASDVGFLSLDAMSAPNTPCPVGSAYSFASASPRVEVGQLVHRVQRRTIAARLSDSGAPAVPEGDEPIIVRQRSGDEEEDGKEEGGRSEAGAEMRGRARSRRRSSCGRKRSRRARDTAHASRERSRGRAEGDGSGSASSSAVPSDEENEDPYQPGSRRLCEHCGLRSVDRHYGTGRFCGSRCARTFSITKRSTTLLDAHSALSLAYSLNLSLPLCSSACRYKMKAQPMADAEPGAGACAIPQLPQLSMRGTVVEVSEL